MANEALAGWGSAVFSGGPGADRLAEAVGVYEDTFGGETHVLEDTNQYQAIICNGLQFGAVNISGYAVEDTAERRSTALTPGDQIGDGKRCSWAEDNDSGTNYNQGYLFGNEDDITCGSLGGTATGTCDVRYCQIFPDQVGSCE